MILGFHQSSSGFDFHPSHSSLENGEAQGVNEGRSGDRAHGQGAARQGWVWVGLWEAKIIIKELLGNLPAPESFVKMLRYLCI